MRDKDTDRDRESKIHREEKKEIRKRRQRDRENKFNDYQILLNLGLSKIFLLKPRNLKYMEWRFMYLHFFNAFL